jgi:xylulose-5-phosphate/fructose-6-phosphate phosphoketolase
LFSLYHGALHEIKGTPSFTVIDENYINLMVGSKQPSAVWLSADEAEAHCRAGAGIWGFASTDKGVNPDVVICGIGAEMMFEVITAAALLRRIAPALRVRVVNVTDLMVLGEVGSHPHALTQDDFEAIFTKDKPVHFNYHGTSFEMALT